MKTTQTKKEKEATKKENEDIAKATNLIVELMHLNENMVDEKSTIRRVSLQELIGV